VHLTEPERLYSVKKERVNDNGTQGHVDRHRLGINAKEVWNVIRNDLNNVARIITDRIATLDRALK